MLQAAAAAQTLAGSLNRLNGQNVSVGSSSNNITRNLNQTTQAMNRSSGTLDTYTGRLGLFASVLGTVAPALVPVGAVAVPAVMGLANALGAAAVAGGTAILAFQGVGDALTAVNDAALDPSSANMAKAEAALRQLSPAAQDLVLRLQDLRPAFEGLRDVAAEGMFPGVLEAFDSIETRIPEVERIIARVSSTLGGLVADAGAGLASSEFDDFFAMVENEVPATLVTLGEAVGNVTKGLADLWVAFAPLGDDFNGAILDASQSFADWADNLSQTQGFTDFVAYVRESGPQVAEAVGAIANAMIQIVTAAAPLGGVVLNGVEAFANAVAAIAGSELGVPIMAAVTAMSALNLAMGAFQAVAGSAIVTRLAAEMGTLAGAMNVASVAGTALGAALAVALPVGLALLVGHLDDANLSAAEMSDGLNQLADTGTADVFNNLTFGAENLGDALHNAAFDELSQWFGSADEIQQMDTALASLFAQDPGQATDAFASIAEEADAAGVPLNRLIELFPQYTAAANAAGAAIPGDFGNNIIKATSDQLQRAMDVLAESPAGRESAVSDAIADIGKEALTAADSAEALSAALDALLSPQLGLSEATDAFEGSLRGLNDSLAEQTRSLRGFGEGALQNREVIRGLASDLQGIMVAQAEAGAGPRQLARSLEQGRAKIMEFGTAAGLSRGELRGFIDQMGLTPRLVRTVLRAQGMKEAAADAAALRESFQTLPKDVRTRIRADGIPKTKADLADLDKAVGGLTKKERRIVVDLMDAAAKSKVNNLDGLLKKLDSQRPKPTADVNAGPALGALAGVNAALSRTAQHNVTPAVNVGGSALGTISAIQSGLNSIQSKSVTVTVNRVMRGSAQLGVAGGGYIQGPGSATSDSIPAWLSNGEYVVRAAAVQRYGRELFDRLNAQAYARGGPVRTAPAQALSVRFSDVNLTGSVDTGAGLAVLRGVARAEAQQVLREAERARDRRVRAGART